MKDQIANEVTDLDKYEYNLKLEEIDKLVDQGDYEEAASLADTIDWRRVRNVRTLCLISEIYEAAGKLDKSKDMLLRAYRKSPVGRTVLYRLVEVTTALGQYDEALEYFSEYVQVAPHDNNRYILKYMIYKGRGSSPEDLIAILEEYLGQEYTERWAYELALNYQQAGQMQKCLAACDDLVLWFHSGKYVKKALDLKKQYAELTPKQQEIYENCLQEEAQEDYDEAGEAIADDTDGDVIAENIIAETEREIAGAVSARKAEKDTAEEPAGEILSTIEESATEKEPLAEGPAAETEEEPAAETESEPAAEAEEGSAAEAEAGPAAEAEEGSAAETESEPVAEEAEEESAGEIVSTIEESATEKEPLAEGPAAETEAEPAAETESEPAAEAEEGSAAEAESEAEAEPAAEEEAAAEEAEESAGEILSTIEEIATEKEPLAEEPAAETEAEPAAEVPEAAGSAEPEEEPENTDQDDLQVELAKSVRKVISGVAHKPELNEDDVPAAVEERLRNIQDTPTRKEPEPKAAKLSIDDVLLSMGDKGREVAKTVQAAGTAGAAAAAAVTGAKKDEEAAAETAAEPEGETVKETAVSEEEETAGVIQEETEETGQYAQPHAMPGRSRSVAEEMTEDLTQEQLEALKYSDNPGKFLRNRSSLPTYSSEEDLENTRVIADTREEMRKTASREQLEAETIRIPTDEVARAYGQDLPEDEDETPEAKEIDLNWKEQETERLMEEIEQERAKASLAGEEEELDGEEEDIEEEDTAEEGEEEEYIEDTLTIEPHLRGLFQGFTEVEGLEDQIANAILQVMSKGDDRTSRSGNILIFGAHGSGKTTLATEIARAIAQEKGNKVARIARIYAADLNRKDIAATIAKIAGGTLIVEEAGDLEDKTVEQLTTAMEFRTDGLIVILEDEQRYVHELLMNHPRFTMKFTAQIYLPDYTLEELLVFGQMHANEQGYKISDEALPVIRQKVDAARQTDTPITIGSMIEMVDDAIRHSNKFMRKLTMGKERYDEDNDTLLFEKDFK